MSGRHAGPYDRDGNADTQSSAPSTQLPAQAQRARVARAGDGPAEPQPRSRVTSSASDHEEGLKELKEGKGTASAKEIIQSLC